MSDRRSRQWAVVRDKAPTPEWECRDVEPYDRDFFQRIAAQHGTAFARRMWRHFEDLEQILRETDGDEDVQSGDVRRFGEQMKERDAADAAAFAEVLVLYRIVTGGRFFRSAAVP